MLDFPKVTVTQQYESVTPPSYRPLRVPAIVGPCVYIVDFLNRTGGFNTDAYAGEYVGTADDTVVSYPSIHSDAEVLTESVRVFFLFGDKTYYELDDTEFTPSSDSVTIKGGAGDLDVGAKVDVYIQYLATRTSVCPSLTITGEHGTGVWVESISDIENLLGPIDLRNPLAFAAYLMQSAANIPVYAIGTRNIVLTVNNGVITSIDGDEESYAAAAEILENERNIYTVTPLTFNPSYIGYFVSHVDNMRQPDVGKWRKLFACLDRPTKYPDETLASGARANGTKDESTLTVDVNLESIKTKVNDSTTVRLSSGGTAKDYAVDSVSGFTITLTDPLDQNWVDAVWSLKNPGADFTNRTDVLEAVGEIGKGYSNLAVHLFYPNKFLMTIDGVETEVNGYYDAAIRAAQRCSMRPEKTLQGKPNPIFSGAVGSNDEFSETALRYVLDGGVCVELNAGDTVILGRAISTDTSTIDKLEENCTSQVDYISAKILRACTPLLRERELTPTFISTQLAPLVHIICEDAMTSGIIGKANVLEIGQSPTDPSRAVVKINIQTIKPVVGIDVTLII